MIASLGMYDAADCQAANDRYWALIRDHLATQSCEVPAALLRGPDAYWPAWQSPDLILSQTCGYPYRARLHGKVTLVGTPDFGVEGCPPGYYRSLFIARKDDPRQTLRDFSGATFTYNEAMSQSGWAAPISHAQTIGLDLRIGAPSGGHALSAQVVAEGRADLAAVDAVTWRLIQRNAPKIADCLRVVDATPPSPGLPYITATHRDPVPLRAAIVAAIAALTPTDRNTLGLRALVLLPPEAYLSVPTPPAPDHFAQNI